MAQQKNEQKANNIKSKCITSPSKPLAFEKKCCTCFSFMLGYRLKDRGIEWLLYFAAAFLSAMRERRRTRRTITDADIKGDSLQLALVQLHDLFYAGVAGVARAAGVGKSGLSKELDIFFLQDAVQVCGDADVCA